jgi:putative iron-regulated protein
MKYTGQSVLVLSAALSAVACGSSSDDGTGVSKQAVIAGYVDIVHATMVDATNDAKALDKSVHELIAKPSQKTLDAARDAWKGARESYLQTEVFRYYLGPIDAVEGDINAWPLDEAYIDYVIGKPDSGIINDPSKTIDTDTLLKLNEHGGEENIATGYHAIEFLLWGQDTDPDGPGDRPYTDYVTEGDDAGENAERRAQYLTVVSDLLVQQLSDITRDWDPGDETNFRNKTFLKEKPDRALGQMLTGLYKLSKFETGGERLQAALDSGDQNDEHSCFSDNTHRDMIQDVQGMKNVWSGTYVSKQLNETIEVPGIGELVKDADPVLYKHLNKEIGQSWDAANHLEIPFDRAIAKDNPKGREGVTALVESLQALGELIGQVTTELGLELVTQDK